MTQHLKQARDAISRMIENGSCPESIAPHIDTILDLLGKEIDGGWQPIETAPRDGEFDALVKTKFGNIYAGFRGINGRWSAEDPRGGGDYYIHDEITHWMPLPKTPAKDE